MGISATLDPLAVVSVSVESITRNLQTHLPTKCIQVMSVGLAGHVIPENIAKIVNLTTLGCARPAPHVTVQTKYESTAFRFQALMMRWVAVYQSNL